MHVISKIIIIIAALSGVFRIHAEPVTELEKIQSAFKGQYDEISSLSNGMYSLRKGEKIGFYNAAKDKIITEIKYDRYSSFYGFKETGNPDVFVTEVSIKGKFALIDSNGKELTKFKYNKIDSLNFKLGLFPVEYKKREGLLDTNGVEVVPPDYKAVMLPEGKRSVVIVKKKKFYGVYDFKKMKEVIPCKYRDIRFSSDENYYFARNGKNWGVITNNNSVLLPFKYDDMGDSRKDVFTVKTKEGWKFVNKDGEQMGSFAYEDIKYRYSNEYSFGELSHNMILVKRNGVWGTASETGEEIIKPQFDAEFQFYKERCDRAETSLNGKPVYINPQGEVVAKQKEDYTEISGFSNDCTARAKIGNHYGVISKDGEIKIPFLYDMIGESSYWYGLEYYKQVIPVTQSGMIGFVNNKGKLIVPCQYESYGFLSYIGELGVYAPAFGVYRGIIAVKNKNNQWGLINSVNKTVLPFEYDEIFTPDGELVKVTNKNGTYYFNLKKKKLEKLQKK